MLSQRIAGTGRGMHSCIADTHNVVSMFFPFLNAMAEGANSADFINRQKRVLKCARKSAKKMYGI